ncbi:MAG: ATP-binding protein [Steroidobacteraceae bacterium]
MSTIASRLFPAPTSATARIVLAAIYAFSYVALDWISYFQPILKLGITPWNPQAGLTFAYLLWVGPRWGLVTAAAAFTAELLVRGAPANPLLLVMSSLWIAGCYAGAAAVLGAQVANRATLGLLPAVKFAAIAVLASLLVASGYVALFVAGHALPGAAAAGGVLRYWVGDVNGILMLTPLLLYLRQGGRGFAALSGRWPEVLAQLATLALFVWLLFGIDVSDDRLRFFYPLFVPVIWIAVRWGALGALVAALAIQLGIAIALHDAVTEAPLIDLQILMLSLELTGLLLGAVVTERASALHRLAAGEAELRAVLSAAPDAVITADPVGTLRTGNLAANQLFGMDSEVAAVSLHQLLPGLQLDTDNSRRTLTATRLDGGQFPADVAWVSLDPPAHPGWLLIVRDATERLRAQNEAQERDRVMARAMRFAVAGELASSLAHELNQPITALVSYLRASQIMAAAGSDADDRLAGTLTKASNEAIRAAQVLHRLRDFYQGSTSPSARADVLQCCASVVELLGNRPQKQGVQLSIESPVAVPAVQADRIQVEMVLHNLISNALDALSATEAGKVLVTVSKDSGRVLIGVHDSGTGVSEDALPQLFEPFNTTKPDGMGLGLAISRNLVRANGGDLLYRRSSRLGGACFEMQLDAAPRNTTSPQSGEA